jgi:hypothetical protein
MLPTYLNLNSFLSTKNGTRIFRTGLFLLMAASPAFSFDIVARRSDNYDFNRRDGRFDVRLNVFGRTEIAVRENRIEIGRTQGRDPYDAGSEYRQEIPRARLIGLRIDQRDGRDGYRILEEPNARNGFALVLLIDDRGRGEDRYHLRITWEDADQRQFDNRSRRDGWERFPSNGDFRSGDFRSGDRGNGNFGRRESWNGDRIPDFLVGNFVGVGFEYAERFTLSIDRRGRVQGFSQNGPFRAELRDGMLWAHPNRFFVERTRNGFRTIEVGNERNVSEYRRR